jgi:hypothetical protein
VRPPDAPGYQSQPPHFNDSLELEPDAADASRLCGQGSIYTATSEGRAGLYVPCRRNNTLVADSAASIRYLGVATNMRS